MNKKTTLLAAVCTFSASGYVHADPLSNDIEHIVVTSTYSEKLASRAPASVSVITAEDLERRQVMDLADAIRGLSGVNISAVGFGRQGVEIRGMDSDQTLILIDGQRVGGTADLIAHSNYELSAINVADIERIEVVRGPMSALYGSDALGGVVNVITKTPTKGWNSQLYALGNWVDGTNSENDYQLQGSTSGALIEDVLALRVSVAKQYQHEMPNKYNERLSDIEGQKSQQVRAQLQWTPVESQSIQLTLAGSQDDRWRNTQQGPAFYTFLDEIERSQFALQHKGNWNWGRSTARIYRSEVDRENFRTAGITPTNPSKLTEDIAEGNIATGMGRHSLHVGGQWLRQNLKDDVVSERGESQAIQTAFFVQDDIALGDHLSLLVGSRFDHHSDFGWEPSPRMYAVYDLGNWVFKGGYGEGFKAPSLKQLSPEYETIAGGGRFTIVGNPDLQPESNRSYEASAQYLADNWRVGTTVFYTQVNDLIETFCVINCTGAPGAIRHYRNVEKATLQGVELNTSWSMTDAVRLSANASYLDARNDSTDAWLLNKPRTSGYAAITWQASTQLDTQLRVEHVGNQQLTAGRLPSYRLLHMSVGYDVNDAWRVRAGINNLTDVYLPDESESFEFVEPGRTVYLSVAVSF